MKKEDIPNFHFLEGNGYNGAGHWEDEETLFDARTA
jgi:hypothetical protein